MRPFLSPFFLTFCVTLAACTTPAMRVDAGLAQRSPALPVNGREGWLINQRLGFGAFTAGPVKRSWTRGYDIPFIVRFSGAREQLGFRASDGTGSTAEVFCLGKLRERDLPVLNKAFEVNLQTRDVFTCSIVVDAVGTYDFYVTDINQSMWTNTVGGQFDAEGFSALIRPVAALDSGQQKSWGTQPLGYEFVHQGRAVAAVETVNAGRVWLDEHLRPPDRLALASAATALLLRSDLADHNDDF